MKIDSVLLENFSAVIPNAEEIIDRVLPNLWVFLSHVLASIILLIMVIYFAWKPTKKFLASRKKEINKDLEVAQQAKLEADKNWELSKSNLLESKDTAKHIVEVAQIEAIDYKNKMEKETFEKVARIEKQFEHAIKVQEKELAQKMNLKVSKLALETAEIFLGKKIDKEANQEMVDKIVSDLEKRINAKDKE